MRSTASSRKTRSGSRSSAGPTIGRLLSSLRWVSSLCWEIRSSSSEFGSRRHEKPRQTEWEWRSATTRRTTCLPMLEPSSQRADRQALQVLQADQRRREVFAPFSRLVVRAVPRAVSRARPGECGVRIVIAVPRSGSRGIDHEADLWPASNCRAGSTGIVTTAWSFSSAGAIGDDVRRSSYSRS